MKVFFLSILFLSGYTSSVFAQKSQPSVGKVDKADLEMKECDFDKGAAALTLIDFGNTYYDRGTVGISTFKTIYERRTRIKILKEKGISEADVEIPYFNQNNEERIQKLNAYTYNLDESGKVKVTEVKKSSIYSKKIDGSHSKMIIAFPEVKVGSIIEYSYTIERETIQIRNWFFQGRNPVRYSEYQLKIPEFFRFSLQPSVFDSIEDKQELLNESISMDEGFVETKVLKSNYIMRNLPGIKDEPFMGSPIDYVQRLEFQLSQIDYGEGHVLDLRNKWSDVVHDLMKAEDFGLQMDKPIPGSQVITEQASQIADAETKMRFIYNQVRKNINWNNDEDIFTDQGLARAWETKSGNAADINLLLVRLLQDAGLKATPILFSTREHGLAVPLYPFVNQFNIVMAYITINDKFFVLDATDKIINYKLTPEKVVNTNGFILEGENGRWKEILSGKSHYKVMSATQGQIDAEGNMKGNCLVNCYDYARVQRCEEWTENKETFKDEHFIKPFPALKIEEVVVNNLEADSLPLEQKIKFNSSLNSSGDYRYFTINLFSDLEKNYFIADNRVADVDFGVQKEYIIFGNYNIPPDYVFDGVPENIAMSTPDKGVIFNRSIQVEGNLLNVRITLEYKRSFYPANTYNDFKEFHKKMFDKLNEQVVIKKKTTP